jgi:hypothetical protein
MTMLMHTRGPLQRPPYSTQARDAAGAGAGAAQLAMIKRFCLSALAILGASGLLVAIMALKVLVYLPRFHYF